MNIPTNFAVKVQTPEPVTVKLDVSERTMMLAGFLVVAGALVINKLKRK